MRERQARLSARKSRVKAYRHVKKMLCLCVVVPIEAAHMPQPPVMGLPRVERLRRLQNGMMPLAGFNLAVDVGDDQVTNLVQNLQGIVLSAAKRASPDDAGADSFGQLNGHDQLAGVALQRSAHEVIDIQ
jgi:hypothetical protein